MRGNFGKAIRDEAIPARAELLELLELFGELGLVHQLAAPQFPILAGEKRNADQHETADQV